jgi:sigma-B regulation protein RsbU (phosphoserine phosphatase)
MILMYTDGVPEASDKEGEEYGYDRFSEVLRKNLKLSPNLLTREVLASIRGFTKEAPQSDDITTLFLKYRLRITPSC